MLLPDSNILVYAFRIERPEHDEARAWLDQALDDHVPIGLCSAALVGFARVCTHPHVFPSPSDTAATLEFIAALWSSPIAKRAEPGPSYSELFAELATTTRATGNALPDVHLAALTIENGAELVTHDRGFARFPGLRWSDPIS